MGCEVMKFVKAGLETGDTNGSDSTMGILLPGCLRFRLATERGTGGGEHSKALVVCLLLRSLVTRQA